MNKILSYINRPVAIAPLVVFRILFGTLCFFGMIWSVMKGEIQGRYWDAIFYFKYSGFEWLPYPGDIGIIILYIASAVGALGIAIGAFYRISVAVFAISFSYLHSVDATNFINHYYLIWIFAVYLFFVPTNSAFSLDVYYGFKKKSNTVPAWNKYIFLIQIGIVYTFAGIAKLNYDWIFRAMPLKIWLGQQLDFPVFGSFFSQNWVHYGLSWFGAFYDLSVIWFLLWKKSRPYAFLAVLIFHLMTASLFDIGLFPALMIISCLLFFDERLHENVLKKVGYKPSSLKVEKRKIYVEVFLSIFVFFQLFLPLRHHFFSDRNILWTQEYYRYGWRVMLVENEGVAVFTVKDPDSGKFWEVNNEDFLTAYQVKRMSVQPDHIRQFAKYLSRIYTEKYKLKQVSVFCNVNVTLNGRMSYQLVDPNIDLSKIKNTLYEKKWILDPGF